MITISKLYMHQPQLLCGHKGYLSKYLPTSATKNQECFFYFQAFKRFLVFTKKSNSKSFYNNNNNNIKDYMVHYFESSKTL